MARKMHSNYRLKKVVLIGLLNLGLCCLCPAQTGKVGINTTSPLAMLHVKDSSVLFTGPVNLPLSPDPPVSGQGHRMMWYSARAAFRTGYVHSTNWNKSNVGYYSFAAGNDTRASGTSSIALGAGAVASNTNAVAIGHLTVASGEVSLASGSQTTASGSASTTFGFGSVASAFASFAGGNNSTASGTASIALGNAAFAIGNTSTAFGNNTYAFGESTTAIGEGTQARGVRSLSAGYSTRAHGFASTVIGQFNDTIVAPQTSISATTPLFIIGNGESNSTRSNAMVVLKNGKTGIGTNAPENRLDVRSDGAANTPEIVLGLISDVSNRPVLQFSELATATPTSGMSIEYDGTGSGSNNKLHIRGDDAMRKVTILNDGRVGIATESPTRELSISDIGGNGDAIIQLSATVGGAKDFILGVNQSSGGILGLITATNLNIRTDNINRMTITSTGNVGIGQTSPTEKLHVEGNICYTGSIAACSDLRYKTNFLPISDVMPGLLKVGTYHYDWDTSLFPDKGFNTSRQLGVIAQEVQQHFPEIVLTDAKGFLSVDYSRLSVLLLAGIKDQQQIILGQQEILANQQELITELAQRVAALEQNMQTTTPTKQLVSH